MTDCEAVSSLQDRLQAVQTVMPERPGVVPPAVFQSDVPIVIKGLTSEWPVLDASDLEGMERYLSGFWIDRPVVAYVGASGIDGRFFYDEHFTGFNFKGGSAPLAQIFDRLKEQESDDDSLAIYVGSTPVDTWLPGFRGANDIEIPAEEALVSFWLGNKTRISAHYDYPDNIACVVAGTRRFTLFPPAARHKLSPSSSPRFPFFGRGIPSFLLFFPCACSSRTLRSRTCFFGRRFSRRPLSCRLLSPC